MNRNPTPLTTYLILPYKAGCGVPDRVSARPRHTPHHTGGRTCTARPFIAELSINSLLSRNTRCPLQNVCGLKFSHEIGGRLYTIEMHLSKDNLWQMRVPRASKSFVLLNEDLYLTYLRESDDALGNVVTKRTLWRLHAARVAASR